MWWMKKEGIKIEGERKKERKNGMEAQKITKKENMWKGMEKSEEEEKDRNGQGEEKI